jgi:hypothetical protein
VRGALAFTRSFTASTSSFVLCFATAVYNCARCFTAVASACACDVDIVRKRARRRGHTCEERAHDGEGTRAKNARARKDASKNAPVHAPPSQTAHGHRQALLLGPNNFPRKAPARQAPERPYWQSPARPREARRSQAERLSPARPRAAWRSQAHRRQRAGRRRQRAGRPLRPFPRPSSSRDFSVRLI